MNDEESEKIITWRKIDNESKSLLNNNKKNGVSKNYTQKEKDYINKYLSISKKVLNEENLYEIIKKFNFNEQLILSEIFHLLDELNDKEKEENKINNIKTNKLSFIPYKTKYGIMKTIYSLKNEKKQIIKVLSKEKIIYKYENNNLNFKINIKNNENNLNENKEDIKNELYPKRFTNFNKIIEDYKNKKYKDETYNNNFYKKINKNYYKNKDKNFGGKYYNDNEIFSYKFYNSKKYKNESIENNEITEKTQKNQKINNNSENNNLNNKNNIIKENIINLNYISQKKNLDKKNECKSYCISDKFQLIIEAQNILKKNDKKINDISKNNNKKIIINKNMIKIPQLQIIKYNNIYNKLKNSINYNNQNVNMNNIEYNNRFNYNNNNKDEKKDNININNYKRRNNYSNNISNYNSVNYNLNNYHSKLYVNNNYNFNPSNYLEINNNIDNNTNNKLYYYTINNNNTAYYRMYNNINNNNRFNNNNILLNQRIGIPIYFPLNINNKYFYPYSYNSNNLISKYVNMNYNTNYNNNIFINSFCLPQMINMYQRLNDNENKNNINNLNNIITPINPMTYYLLMKNFGIRYFPFQNIKKTTI